MKLYQQQQKLLHRTAGGGGGGGGDDSEYYDAGQYIVSGSIKGGVVVGIGSRSRKREKGREGVPMSSPGGRERPAYQGPLHAAACH
jgi:hypothetical protein